MSCTIFRRLWITFWITYRTTCAWVRDNLPIFPQGAKTVLSCSWDTRCLSIQFSIGQVAVYTALTVVIHSSGLPLLTTTMYTYSKPIKTLKPCYERCKKRKTLSGRTVENAALTMRVPTARSSTPRPEQNRSGNKKPRQGGVSLHRSDDHRR